ncbi:pas/pac sensor signal transduction histidine kinase [Flammeovirgaceae bacterium 311]|nr:pas/pac sensor signal transduction histidine kinase [Flammeovirgaceae bacterium 311]
MNIENAGFMAGGGEMGERILSFDWSETAVGPIETWPQSLRTILSVILNSKFPMFLYWGPELICFYNDAFRPSFGIEGKHPRLLGKPGREFWAEAWHEVEPSITHVMAGGEAVWHEDQLIPIYRNGKIENVYWTYSFSPVHDESGTPGGVLVTSIESTQKVLTLTRLEETADELIFAIEATELATWDVNPHTNKLKGNRRLKEWFGLEAHEEVDLQKAVNIIAEQDRQRVIDAIQRAYQFSSGGQYDIEYTIINPLTKQQRYIRAKGRAWFNQNKVAYRFNGTLQDVTTRVLARKRLEESEIRFRSLIEQAPVAIALTRGREMVIETMNAPMLRNLGKENLEEVVGKTLLESMPELKDQPVLDIILGVLDTRKPFNGSEVPVSIKVGENLQQFYFNLAYTPFIEEGKVTAVIHVAVDVTELVNARKKVEENEQQVHDIIESSPFPIGVFFGKEMHIQFANKAIQNSWRKGPNVIGKRYRDVLPELENQTVFEQLNRVFETGIPFHSSNDPLYLLINGQRQTFYYNYSFTPLFNASGEVYGIINSGVDNTDLILAQQRVEKYAQELQESEQRFRLFVQASNDTLYRMSPDWQQMLKLEGRNFLAATDKPKTTWIDEYLPPEDQSRAFETIKEAIRTKGIFELEHRVLKADGTVGWTFSRAIPVLSQEGEIIEWFGAATDITQKKQAEQKLLRLAEELAAANKGLRSSSEQVQESNKMLTSSNQKLSFINADMDNFIYTASHDLRAPISNIEGLMNTILRNLTEESRQDPKIERLFGMVTDSIARFNRTINDLSEITKVQREGTSQEVAPVDLAHIVREIHLDLSAQIEKAAATFEIDMQQCIPLHFSAKNARSIIYNLISNAVKYRSAERPLLVQIHCYKQGEFLVLQVQDNGLGMDLSDENKIFAMFKRLHDHVEGSGVGLYIVKKIVENAGGKIEVESKVNEGSIFRVYFKQSANPLSKTEASENNE